MSDTNDLGHQLKKHIYDMIRVNPGVHCRGLSRQLQIPYSTLLYHVRSLEKQGKLKKERIGKLLCYYTAESEDPENIKMLALFQNNTIRQIILTLLLRTSLSRNELYSKLQRHPTTITEALRKLIALNIITPVKTSEISRMKKIETQDFINKRGDAQFFVLKNPHHISSVVQLFHERFNKDKISTFLIGKILEKEDNPTENEAE